MLAEAKILVVDDDPWLLETCAGLLQDAGYSVAQAHDGRQALERVQAGAFAVVLMDVMMPVLDGLEACRAIKANPATAHVPVVLMSARDRYGPAEEAQAGADAFLAKPFDIDDLLAIVKRALPARS